MIKNLRELSHEENKKMFLQGTSYAMYVANSEKEVYEKSKKGELDEISKYQERDIKILSLLESLGYPMDELGTYLYKDVIVECYKVIKDFSKRDDMEVCRVLMKSLNDAYSCFYRYIASDDKEMGVKSFHLYIEQAIDKIDEDKIDSEIATKVFGSNPEDMNYGLVAFQLASYVANLYSMKPEFNKQKIKALSNLPKDIKLKD